jgi:hypothetical protein
MQEELDKLVQYAESNGFKVVFDSKVLKDYAGMNPEAARAIGFPDIDKDESTREIIIDNSLPLETQVANLKHELVEYKLMKQGMQYWQAHELALKSEKEPFDYSTYITSNTSYTIPFNKHKRKAKRKQLRRNKLTGFYEV